MTMQMNQMKSFYNVMLSVVILLLGTATYAQDKKMADASPEEKAELMTEKQNEKLQFYDDQENRMYDINLKYVKEMERIRSQGRSRKTLMDLRDMSKRKDKEVKQVLDDDQYYTYLEMKEAMREQMRERMKSRDDG